MLILNNTDLLGPDWRFLEPVWMGKQVKWNFFYGIPQSRLERNIRRPNLARYRAAWSTVHAAKRAQEPVAIVSHLPSMAAPTNFFRSLLCPNVPQIAFSFNFTTLPRGHRRRLFSYMFEGIDEFVVFSAAEQDLYAEHFGLDPDRIRFVPWAMETPKPDPIPPVSTSSDYLCAIGGEGRDYALFAQAMQRLPSIRGVVVARPYSIAGISFPKNVEVFTNLPLGQTWSIATHSLGLAIPLKTEKTACGHVTIVGAQHLGVPLVVTRSSGVTDYVSDSTARLVSAGNLKELVLGLTELFDDRDTVLDRCNRARALADLRNRPSVWAEYLADACGRLVV